ncbi:MAG: succinate dehydrogenase, hydrophobic membrane anchor protein [Actinomycetales bacterium]|nr:succinate dehydrogenase, hydrophobic membrane anchor protein [Actinomycetales bacterium]
MSVVIETPRSPRSRKGANWEKYGWLFMRVSGAILVALIFTHLISNLVMGKGITGIDFAFVAGKWASPVVQWLDFTMLVLALIHGTNGMRTIVNDYVERNGLRKTLVWTLWTVCAALIVLGTLVIFTFDPCIDPAAVNYLPQVCKAA